MAPPEARREDRMYALRDEVASAFRSRIAQQIERQTFLAILEMTAVFEMAVFEITVRTWCAFKAEFTSCSTGMSFPKASAYSGCEF